MTELNKDLERELASVRDSFYIMANRFRNGGIGRNMYRVPPMGMRFNGSIDMRYWYSHNTYVERARFNDREWHGMLQNKYNLHKAVEKCMALARPDDWQQLLLEWPHVSDTDPSRLAYTRDERAGEANRQVITTIGKYITRHFPTLASHHVRDITALFAADHCKQVHTTAEMIYHLGRGPQSCMKWNDMDLDSHPYCCYAPKFGWSMAIREEGGDTVARALVYKDGDVSYFVRSYTKNDNFSHSDTILEAWLNSQNIRKRSDWEGAMLAKVSRGKNTWGTTMYVFPYIDGEIKTVDMADDHMLITPHGEYQCDNTDGTADDNEQRTCDDCGDRENEDDGYWVGIEDDSWVCESCRDNEYTYVAGRRGRHYYLHNDNIIEVNNEYYDPEYVNDNNIVQLHDGEYMDSDNAVYIESEGEYYDCDDCDICCDYNGEYQLVDDCVELHNGEWCLTVDAWQCTHSDEWYICGDDESVLTADGDIIHPDYADECEMPEGYEVQPKTAHMTVTKEVAVEPVPFLPTQMSASPSAPSVRDEVIYDVDGLRVTKNHYMNIDLIRYQASKRVYERELCVAYNAGPLELSLGDYVEARIVANLCEQIANMEAELHRQFFTTHLLNANRSFFQQSMTDMVLHGRSFTHVVYDDVTDGIALTNVAHSTTLIGE
jgi:hypothetical protein